MSSRYIKRKKFCVVTKEVIIEFKKQGLTVLSDSVFSLAKREAESISLSSAIVFSSSDLVEKDEEEE